MTHLDPETFFRQTTRQTHDHAPTNVCSSCGGPVRSRRPSSTGEHFCPKPKCQSSKASFYRKAGRRRRKAEVVAGELEQAKITLVHQALHGSRVSCSECGRDDAVNGFPHPTPAWDGACQALGTRGMELNDAWFRTIWPS